MGALTKRELAERISEELGFSIRMSASLVDEFFHQIIKALHQGEKVKMVRFGILEPVIRQARRGTSPVTGEPIEIPAKRTVVFKPSKTLKGMVNAASAEEILSNR